jgi:hypothetical protein
MYAVYYTNQMHSLIDANIKGASTRFCTSVPSSGRTTYQFQKPIATWRAAVYKVYRSVAASLFTLFKYGRENSAYF